MIWLLSLEVSVAVSDGVGREALAVEVSTVIVSSSFSVDVEAIRTVFGRLPGISGSAVRLVEEEGAPKESMDCRRGIAVFDTGRRRSVGDRMLDAGTRAFDASLQVAACATTTC